MEEAILWGREHRWKHPNRSWIKTCLDYHGYGSCLYPVRNRLPTMTEKPQIQSLMNEVSFSISYPIGFSSMNPWRDVCSCSGCLGASCQIWVIGMWNFQGAWREGDRISGTWLAFKLETTSTFHRLLCSRSPHPDLSMHAVQGRSTHSVSTWGAPCLIKIPLLWQKGRLVWGKAWESVCYYRSKKASYSIMCLLVL